MKAKINPIIIILTYLCFRLIGLIAAPDLLIKGRLYYYYFFISLSLILFFLYNKRKTEKRTKFRSLVVSVFFIFFTFFVIDYLIDWYIINWFDPSLIHVMAQEEFAASQEELRRMDALDNTTIEDMENIIKSRYSLSGVLTSILFFIPATAIISMFLAALFLKKEPF